jgi:hypothetical protein
VSVSKIAATLSLVSVLSLVSYGPALSGPLNSLASAAKPGAEDADAVQVRWRRSWHSGGAWAASPYYYGGSYLGYTYGGFPGYHPGYVFPTYDHGYRPYGWWYRPY